MLIRYPTQPKLFKKVEGMGDALPQVKRDNSAVSIQTKRQLVHFATRAPSGHNSQPWKFLLGRDSIEIIPDFARSLLIVDPDHRELFISLGCAAENLLIAASHFNLQGELKLNLASEPISIFIRLHKKSDLPTDPLFEMIERRQTNRREFDHRKLSSEQLTQVKNVMPVPGTVVDYFANGSKQFEKIKGRVTSGNEVQMADEEFKEELLDWIRFNRRHVECRNDGIAHQVMDAPSMPRALGRWVVSRLLDPTVQAVSDLKKIQSSSHLAVVSAQKDDVKHWIGVGRQLQRVLLKTTSIGLAVAYVNQPCEVPEVRRQLGELIGRKHPMIILRIGYAERAMDAPRRPIDEVII